MDRSQTRTLSIWLRLLLLLAAIETLRVAVGLIQPAAVNSFLPWPASPLNARFIASLYGSIGLTLLVAQAARSYDEVRILVAGIFVATSLILLITLTRIALHPGEVPSFPVLWTAFYVLDPVLTALVLWRYGWRNPPAGGSNRAAGVWFATAVVLGALGLIGLFAPQLATAIWPWTITQPQAQIYSAFFLAFAASSVLAACEPDWPAVRLLALSLALLPLLALVSSLLHLNRFHPGPPASLWFAALAALLIAFGGMLAFNAGHDLWRGRRAWSKS
jgi:hypothetical protein